MTSLASSPISRRLILGALAQRVFATYAEKAKMVFS